MRTIEARPISANQMKASAEIETSRSSGPAGSVRSIHSSGPVNGSYGLIRYSKRYTEPYDTYLERKGKGTSNRSG